VIRPRANLKKLSACIDRLLKYNVYLTVPFYQACLAAQMVRYRQHATALKLTEAALKIMARTRETWFEPEIYRIRGMLLADRRPADPSGAETAFKRSLHEARRRKCAGLGATHRAQLRRSLAREGPGNQRPTSCSSR